MKFPTVVLCLSTLAFANAQPVPADEGRIYVALATEKGGASTLRTAEAFHVWENGTSRRVVNAVPAAEAPAIVVVVHGFGRNEMLDMRQGLAAFIGTVRTANPTARLSLITDVATPVLTDVTADAAKDYAPLQDAAQALDKAARRFAMSGSGLRVFEAVEDACAALGKESSGRRLILMLTNTTRYDVEERSAAPVVAALKKAGASLWSVDVTPESAAYTKNMHNSMEVENLLANWTIASGGVHETIFGTRALPDTLTRVAGVMLSQYEVRFSRPGVTAETTLRVGVAGMPGEKVMAPQWYVIR